ncbi:hypothetical protein GJW-30_1_00237 [Variibacter gotjawalensis]|uniref:Uncharacterized protein n=1 Tax=Variibacter gotjawalensis TaxID=1333996 RepID=A0A0S3PP66_9BRAD|nr:hypothetical protein [Variibacter gotjawalensis]NIK48024.1 putative membrane protein (GlpM family) [Variibacter gotjawalensis]RZS49901.1 hypothetical protein EV661_2347 [Variibacter gotjawalensis]BAT57729.1 hypothetical protein GJW-30_1_00237 [Variibacter gotjawalensis]
MFWISLLAKMAITATFVVSVSFMAQRVGPLIAGLVAALPISAGPAYVFLALDHDAAFISQSALTSMVTNVITAVFALTYAALAQKRGVVESYLSAILVWAVLGWLLQQVSWTVTLAFIATAAVYVPCIVLSRRYRAVPMPPSQRRWFDLPLRAAMVSALVFVLVMSSPYVGPVGSGMIAVFPIVLSSLIIILHPRVGPLPTASVIANTIPGLLGFAIALAFLHMTAEPLGVWLAMTIGCAICILWSYGAYALRQRGFQI